MAKCRIEGCATGAKRIYGDLCSIHSWRIQQWGHPGPPGRVRQRYNGRLCSVDACEREARVNGLCSLHSDRKRYGLDLGGAELLRRRPGEGTFGLHGYHEVTRHGHPLADERGRVLAHRALLYDKIGPGPHRCHWCQAEIEWLRDLSDPRMLVVDHLDYDKQNNAEENLMAVCHPCNS